MRYLTFVYIALAAFIFSPAAHAMDVYPSAKVYLRAGPDGGYPVVQLLDRGEKLSLIGCLSSREWCEVRTRYKERGWVYASYLEGVSNGGRVTFITNYGNSVDVVVYEPHYYWDSYYRGKDFYKDRDRWLPKNRKHNYSRYDRVDRPVRDEKLMPENNNPALKAIKSDKYNPLCPMTNPAC